MRGLSNQIRLKQHVNPAEMRMDIESALTRHAQREARQITVTVDSGVVTLRGEVGTMAEHDAVLGTAHAAKGVTRVVDQVEIVG